MGPMTTWSAFLDGVRIAHGPFPALAAALRAHPAWAPDPPWFVFEDETGRQVELDLHGAGPEGVGGGTAGAGGEGTQGEGAEARRPGRPKLGVTAREVTLLPRHWAWLERQPSGASAALRRLVEGAMRADAGPARARQLREAAGRFMSAIAGNLPGYEEASRALYSGDLARLEAEMAAWPPDVKGHVSRLSAAAAEAVTDTSTARSSS